MNLLLKRFEKYALVLLFLVGFFLRIWRVGNYPPLLWDEAALGYNAYSILKTGRDEYGKLLPLIFKSFGDYKPGFYVYLTLPFVSIFGLNELAVRLPSVIFGSLTSVFLYFLVKEVFKDRGVAFWSALSLTFLPWAIHFSRGAWEVNIMTSLLVLGSWLGIKKFRKYALFVFLLTLWTYQGAKMMVPLILLGIIFSLWKPQRRSFKSQTNSQFPTIIFKQTFSLVIRTWRLFGFCGLMFGILALAWYWQSFSGSAKNRLKVMSLFSYRRPELEVMKVLNEDDLRNRNWHFYLFHGEWLYFFRGFLARYFNHFSPEFLAFAGDWNNPRHSAPYFGVIGHLNFILFLVGIICFLSRKGKLSEYFFLYWLAIAPLPAAFSRDIISGVRSLTMIVPISVFIGWGIKCLFSIFKFRFLKIILILLLALDFIYWTDLYFVHMVQRRPKDWLYGYKKATKFVIEHQSSSKKILFTDFYGQPYIYYLFYSRYPPERYQKQARLVENQFGDVGRVEGIDNIFFGTIDRNKIENCPSCLIVFSQDEVLRSGIDKDPQFSAQLKPLGKVGGQPMFYGLINK